MKAAAVRNVAELIRKRNELDRQLVQLTGRPAIVGHLGDWIASQVFDVKLVNAKRSAVDGTFLDGPLTGRTVNIRWYPKREGMLDLAKNGPESYLVLTGPKASTTRDVHRPLLVQAVYLFETEELRRRGVVRTGTAVSVGQQLWDAAEIYPRPNHRYTLTGDQKRLLAEFGR